MADPVISSIVYTKTDTTISATWTTDISADSNIFVSGKNGIDNGVAASGTSHQAIVTGLTPSTNYSCTVRSGATTSAPSSQSTTAAATRTLITTAKAGAFTLGDAVHNQGDTQRTFLSSDNVVYMNQDDNTGIVSGSTSTSQNTSIAGITNETNMTGGANLITTYGAEGTTNGTDGPASAAMTNKSCGLFGLNGNLHMFVYRQLSGVSNRYCNWIKSTNHGSTWNNFNDLTNFVTGGNPVTPNSPSEPVQFYVNTIGLVTPCLYAADDGTLGYTTAGNLIDGGNAFVYMAYSKDNDNTTLFLMRLPRIQFDAQNATPMQYWKGPSYPTPLDFTNDNNWSSSNTDAVNIKVSGGTQFVSLGTGIWQQMAFVPTMNSYIISYSAGFDGTNKTMWLMYSAPTPAGPWRLFFTQPNTAPNKFFNGFFVFHRDIAGNASSSDIAAKFLCSTSPGGTANYSTNFSTLTMQPSSGAQMVQQVFCGFATVENPLSFGSTFTTAPVYSALKVTGAGVCQASATSTNCFMYYSGAVPSGDTGGLWPADHYSECTVGTLTSGALDAMPVTVRQSTTLNTHYRLNVIGQTGSPASSPCTLLAIVNNAVASTLKTINITVAAGDVMRLSVTGTVLTTTQNGVVVDTTTDASNFVPGPGFPGFGAFETIVNQGTVSTWAAGANQASAPTFSPDGGSYTGTQTVTITGPASSTIYYTTDGTTPTRSSTSIASGATISVSASHTVQAIASKTNFVDSQIAGAIYTISAAQVLAGNAGSMRLRRKKRLYAIS